MAILGRIYVCAICGQEVQVTRAGAGTLVCCNKPMILKKEEKEASS